MLVAEGTKPREKAVRRYEVTTLALYRLDQNTGTITARAVLPNADLLLAPGLFARVRMPAGDKYKALMLPPEALGSDLSQQFVFVVDAQNLVQYRKVTPGPIIDAPLPGTALTPMRSIIASTAACGSRSPNTAR